MTTRQQLLNWLTDRLSIPRTIFLFCLNTKIFTRGIARVAIFVIYIFAVELGLSNGFHHLASGLLSGIISFSLFWLALVIIVFFSVVSRHRC